MMHKIQSSVGMQHLLAPRRPGWAFIGRSGWLGFQCPCGWIVSGQSMRALGEGLDDHQVEGHCAEWKALEMPDPEMMAED